MILTCKRSRIFSSFLFFLSIASCASSDKSEIKYESGLKSSVDICDKYLVSNGVQSKREFYVIDADQLNYLIVVVSSALLEQNKSSHFCHIDKPSQSLVYANGENPFLEFLEQGPKTKEYRRRYSGILANKARLGRVSIFKFKLINGIWRYIESRKVLSS